MQSVQLASLERKASEYEDIYSRLEVRQANEEAGPLLEKGEEMKTQREYKLGIFPMATWGGQNYLSSMLTLLPFNVGIFLLVDNVNVDKVDKDLHPCHSLFSVDGHRTLCPSLCNKAPSHLVDKHDGSFLLSPFLCTCLLCGRSFCSFSVSSNCLPGVGTKADACFRSRKAEKEHVTTFKEQIHKVQRASSRRKINSSMVERLLLL